jgi:NAD(P)-dependent dehydrogenase (short-subunit alcohol dehydrogenase family)
VVTGAGGLGIGQACALMFAREGAAVVGCDVNAGYADETQVMADAERLAYSTFVADLTEPAAHDALMTFTVEKHGGVDILATAAALVDFAPITQMDYETEWRRTMLGELDLVFLSCKAAWPHLLARGGGSIINFASADAHAAHPRPGAVAHCATKGGVLAMTRQLASEGGPYNIRANTISPALIVTKLTQKHLEADPVFKETLLKNFLLHRVGRPEDIGYMAVFLASEESSWVTGADFRVDGGATAF